METSIVTLHVADVPALQLLKYHVFFERQLYPGLVEHLPVVPSVCHIYS